KRCGSVAIAREPCGGRRRDRSRSPSRRSPPSLSRWLVRGPRGPASARRRRLDRAPRPQRRRGGAPGGLLRVRSRPLLCPEALAKAGAFSRGSSGAAAPQGERLDLGEIARDVLLVRLERAAADLEKLGVAQETLDLELVAVAPPAEDLHGV